MKVTLTVGGGWSKDSFEVDYNGLEELSTLAKAMGVKLILFEACNALRPGPFPTISDIIRPYPKISLAKMTTDPVWAGITEKWPFFTFS